MAGFVRVHSEEPQPGWRTVPPTATRDRMEASIFSSASFNFTGSGKTPGRIALYHFQNNGIEPVIALHQSRGGKPLGAQR